MTYRVTHRTLYSYAAPAALSQNETCLQIRDTSHQRVLDQGWETAPAPDHTLDYADFFGNRRRSFSFERPHQELCITCWHRVEVGPPVRRLSDNDHLAAFLQPSPFVTFSPPASAWAKSSFPLGRSRYDGLLELNGRIHEEFTYDPKATSIDTSVEEFFTMKRGVCQDYSQLMISVLRSIGVPARYVSGYLNTRPPPGKEKVLGADASHAWVSAYIEGMGWIDVDPTNGVVVETDHITVSWGRDYGDVTPLKGVALGGGTQTLKVEVTVDPLAGQ